MRKRPPLARFGALLAATAGALSTMSALNAPLIGNVARISVPLFAFAVAFILVVAGQENRRLKTAAAIVFLIALAVLQYDLTRDALWENSGISAVQTRSDREDPRDHRRAAEGAEPRRDSEAASA